MCPDAFLFIGRVKWNKIDYQIKRKVKAEEFVVKAQNDKKKFHCTNWLKILLKDKKWLILKAQNNKNYS